MSAHITITGNLVADPEIFFDPKGKVRAKFRVASTRRTQGPNGVWHDAETTFWRCTAFAQLAEHMADTLRKGDAIIVNGRANSHSWETSDGQKRERIEVTAEHVGLDLKVNRERRDKTPTTAVEADPWNTPSAPIPF